MSVCPSVWVAKRGADAPLFANKKNINKNKKEEMRSAELEEELLQSSTLNDYKETKIWRQIKPLQMERIIKRRNMCVWRSSRSAFGRSTGTDVSDHNKQHFFSTLTTFLIEGVVRSKNFFCESWPECPKI